MTIERITAAAYTSDGATLVSTLAHLNAQMFRDEVSQRGSAGLTIPIEDAEDIAADSIIKFTWRGSIRFGCVINSESCEYAVAGRRWLSFQNQPGLLSLLDQAVIQPEYGLDRRSGDTRRFGYMSKLGAWLISGDWLLPEAVLFNDEIAPRWHHPPELKPAAGAVQPAWIAALPGPDTTVATGTKNWFRYPFTIATEVNTRIVWAGDNYTNAYFDGEQIGTADQLNQWAWRNAAPPVDQTMVVGDHVLAFDVENAPPVAGHTFNPVGLICTVYTLDTKGEPDGILFTSDPATYPDWRVCKVKPGWHKGYLIGEMLEEAQARSIPGALALTATFTDTHDSNGDPWDDVVDEYAYDIETTTLADLIISLCESGINAHVNAADMTLNLYNRMGTDKYGTVEFTLGEGSSLTSYQLDSTNARATSVAAHIEDGTWLLKEDAAGIAAVGRREIGYAAGTAPNAATAGAFALQQLAESAAAQIQITAKTHIGRGPQFYDDLGLGDSVKLPGLRMVGNLKGRALAVTVAQEGDEVTVTPEFMKDST